MPTVTLDHRGLTIDGTRRWIVSGTIDPARVPAELWPHRLRAALEAGLNTVLVPAVWSVHEPRSGAFDFSGDQDIAAFIRMAGELGLMVVLRPGPFQGSGWDRGGIPAWVTAGSTEDGNTKALRSASPEFLKSCAAWLRALGGQLRSLQATEGGPIVLVQSEHRWFCGDQTQARGYLGELGRYLHESGFTAPQLNTNNLFAAAEGEIDAWNGLDDLAGTLRQLRAVRPEQPVLAWDVELGRSSTWEHPSTPIAPNEGLHKLAQAFAAGGQVNLGPFAGGSRFGFSGGRMPFSRDGFYTQSADDGAPLDEAGQPTALLDALRPLLLFASSFERLFAMAEWRAASACLAPQPAAESVVQATGEAGSVVFILRDPGAKSKNMKRELLLSDGRRFCVDLKDRPAVWCLLETPLGSNSTIDYTNASVIWAGSRAIALTAPVGSLVEISLNGSMLEGAPSRGRTPSIIEHEGVTVALLSTEQAAAAVRTPEGLLIGADAAGRPREGWKKWALISPDGGVQRGGWDSPERTSSRRTLTGWTRAGTEDVTSGKSERFAVIDDPDTLDALGVPEGYGWMRLRLSNTSSRKPMVLAAESGDRVHFFRAGKFVETAGLGPDATEDPFVLPIAKGKQTVVALLDNLGRPSGGWSELQRKGLWGSIFEVKPFKAGTPSVEIFPALNPLEFRSPLTRLHTDDETHTGRVTWSFMYRRKSPLLFRAGTLPTGVSGLLVVNDVIVDVLDEGSRGDFVLRGDVLRTGKNVVQFAPLSDPAEALAVLKSGALFFECVDNLAAGAEWAFARWEMPRDRMFTEIHNDEARDDPAWWRATFPAQRGAEPLVFDPKGLTKGQVFLNGHNVGRYFAATRDGKKLAGQRGVYLPEPWVHHDRPNVLTIFDEHGAAPSGCRVSEFRKLRG